ncbi:MAG: hypothetical protein ISR75_01350 [Phycisphaerales bacterium]|nr:hypothetical protein [Planctomycetota bacterium]MBL6997071.1 hypothetical protein [Phycisphaerales bacterium]
MKRKDDTLAILFVTVLAVFIWLWAAARTEDERNINTTLYFVAPEGSSSTITPQIKPVRLSLKGPRSALNAADEACLDGISVSITADDGEVPIDLASEINKLDVIRSTGAEIVAVNPSSLTVEVQTVVLVDAVVVPSLPSVTVSGDVTVDPATVTLRIPQQLQRTLPEAVTVNAIVSETVLAQLQPGVVHTLDASIQLPEVLDEHGVIIEPNRVSLSFKIQSKTDKVTLPQVRVLIAAPAEDYAAYSVALPVKIIPNVTIEADKELIASISSGDVTVFAIVRLASQDMEKRVETKLVTSFMAMLDDDTGVQVKAKPEDAASLNVVLQIEPVPIPTAP